MTLMLNFELVGPK